MPTGRHLASSLRRLEEAAPIGHYSYVHRMVFFTDDYLHPAVGCGPGEIRHHHPVPLPVLLWVFSCTGVSGR